MGMRIYHIRKRRKKQTTMKDVSNWFVANNRHVTIDVDWNNRCLTTINVSFSFGFVRMRRNFKHPSGLHLQSIIKWATSCQLVSTHTHTQRTTFTFRWTTPHHNDGETFCVHLPPFNIANNIDDQDLFVNPSLWTTLIWSIYAPQLIY